MPIKIITDSTVDLPVLINTMHDLDIGKIVIALFRINTGARDCTGAF